MKTKTMGCNSFSSWPLPISVLANFSIRAGNVSGDVNNSGTIIEANGLNFETSIVNSKTGAINVGSDANVTVAGDLIQNGSLVVSGGGGTTSSVYVDSTFLGREGLRGGGGDFLEADSGSEILPASVMMDGDLVLADSSGPPRLKTT